MFVSIFNVCLFFKPSDLKSDGHCASCIYFFLFLCFLNHLINLVAVMKSGPSDLSDGPDLSSAELIFFSLFSLCFFLLIYTIIFTFSFFISLTLNVCHCLLIFTFLYYLIVVYFASIFLCLKLLHAYLICATHFIIIILLVCI